MTDPNWMKRDRAFFKQNPDCKVMVRRAGENEGFIEGTVLKANGKEVADDPMSQLKAMADLPLPDMECDDGWTMLVLVFRAPLGGRGRVNMPTPRYRVRQALKFEEPVLHDILLQIAPEVAHLVEGAKG